MAKGRLRLYRLDPEYVHELSLHDKRVMSIEPNENKDKRPFVGIVIPPGRRWYCIPLSSPKPKHATMKADRDFSKIADTHGKLIGVLNFNNMIPVNDSVLIDFDIRVHSDDTASEKAYKI